MSKSDGSSFWTTGIWVLLRYLALPILLAAAVYIFGGPSNRVRINARLYAMIAPIHEAVATVTGNSELLQARHHMRDPDLAGTSVVRLSDLPVAAVVPVVNLDDLPELEGPSHVQLSDLPEPIEDSVVFLLTKPEPTHSVSESPRPRHRPEPAPLKVSQQPPGPKSTGNLGFSAR